MSDDQHPGGAPGDDGPAKDPWDLPVPSLEPYPGQQPAESEADVQPEAEPAVPESDADPTAPAGRPSESGASRSCPGRVTPTRCASAGISSARCQVARPARASAPVMKKSSTSGPSSARRSVRVSTVYVGPSRSTSTRDAARRGSGSVAMTVMA